MLQAPQGSGSPDQEALLAVVRNIVEAVRLLMAENKAHERENARLEVNFAEAKKRELGSTCVNACVTVASTPPAASSLRVEPDIIRS